MMLFPTSFTGPEGISRLLYYSAIWGGGRTTGVWIQGFSAMRTHVREISRSPSSGRVERLSQILNLISSQNDNALFLPPDIASELFCAALTEAPALLELGYPRDEPATFRTSLPSPGRNSRRTRNQIRSAVHHLGGDIELLKAMMRTAEANDPSLEVVFAVWPPQHMQEGKFILRLGYPGQTVPAVMILDERLVGYVLLACWDLALRLRDTDKIPTTTSDFRSFSTGVINS